MTAFPAPNRKVQPDIIKQRPDTTADKEARGILRVASVNHPGKSKVPNGNGRSQGNKQGGGARISGGKG